MRKIIVGLVVAVISTSSLAEEKFWIEGSEQPSARVNVDLKSLSPKAYLNVSEKVNQSVVNISTTQTVKGIQTPFGFQPEDPNGNDQGGLPFFGPDLFNQFFGGAPSQPKTQKEASLGSGFVLNRDGYIVTNNHVVAQADEIQITFYDESEATAKLIGRDAKTDVALLKVERLPAKLDPVIFGDSDAMKVGEIVVAIGNPFGLSHSVTQGIISAKERAIGLGPYDDFIQTDASINPGNSGGPLVNLYGEVIGINAAIHAGGQGIGFAIPINSAKDVLRKLKKDGKVVRAQLGVQIQKLTDDHVKALKLKSRDGALVSQVMEGSPAEQAGIKAGDVIVGVDEKKIKDWHTLPLLVSNIPVGKKIKIDLIRNSVSKSVVVQVGEQKDEGEDQVTESHNNPKKDALGLTVQNLTKDISQSLGLGPNQKGVLVGEIDPDSTAASKGIRRGDVIVEVNRKNIGTVDDYTDAVKGLKKGDSVLLLIVRKQGTVFVAFEL
jgi:serine protease Do